ncbi:MAG: hypothetical protein JXA13_13535 [Anaerolineales bacterium]|nr:hypothetical protein [Anaerolineales bacterium]
MKKFLLNGKVVILICLVVLALSCQAPAFMEGIMAGATVTSTATARPTRTPVPTRTPKPTSTPVQLVDISGVVLDLEDLHSSFRVCSDRELGIEGDTEDLVSYNFKYDAGHNFIYAWTERLPKEVDRNYVDIVIEDAERLPGYINLDEDPLKMTPIKELSDLGDASVGVRMIIGDSDYKENLDFFLMRRDMIVVQVLVVYPDGTRPMVNIQELAQILERRAEEAVENSP